MFKFGFSENKQDEVRGEDTKKSTINWIPASEVEVSESELQIENRYKPNDYRECLFFPDCKLKLIRFERALHDLQKNNCTNILEAESQHSDLIPAKYEGGLKIWECSYDLGQYLLKNIEFQDKFVLDLGCGTGIIGLVALLKNSIVHFQDYNVEVIKTVTIPNVLLNFEDRESILNRCQFFCGDWESFTKLRDSNNGDEFVEYDLIFTSETIYNPDNHKKLYEVFKRRLKANGVGFIAGKSYYFGVGGGMRQFQDLIEEDAIFDVEIVWTNREGLQREILKITRKQQS
ncbi:histidine protein methyltransferase 1 homolog isoform X1 [Bombus vancouverensis nearcticus]|uniref:protein-histidine N-methyltransferase n=1 Tax=Bombus bifarius TaxID=103933 RepID=A0A6P8MEK9_9HYME|nr:histidine protein methyltransferase 1 homolog [Bombus vancouverensis nearcticus]XP_033307994.1 histidine protein methyltransferase 1 homolog isoform X2 [Bombus bifarius]